MSCGVNSSLCKVHGCMCACLRLYMNVEMCTCLCVAFPVCMHIGLYTCVPWICNDLHMYIHISVCVLVHGHIPWHIIVRLYARACSL